LLIYPMICETIFNLGVGMIVSAMFIFFKDMSHLYSIITSTLMFFSAVFYPITRFPAHLQRVFMFNPIYIYIKYFRDIVIDSKIPSLQIHALALGYALLFFVIGILVYKKFNYKFLYYI
jgi:ABC-2 type transport system permease protein